MGYSVLCVVVCRERLVGVYLLADRFVAVVGILTGTDGCCGVDEAGRPASQYRVLQTTATRILLWVG